MRLLRRADIQTLKEDRDVKGLIKALDDKDVGVRSEAAEMLGEIGDERSILPLVKCVLVHPLFGEDEEARRAAGRALPKIGPHAVAPLVEALDMAYDSAKVRGVYKDAIVSIKKRWARNPQLLLIGAAATTLGELEWEPAVERLSRLRPELTALAETAKSEEMRLIARHQIPLGSRTDDLIYASKAVGSALTEILQARASRPRVPTPHGSSVTSGNDVYAFFVRAEERVGETIVDTTGDEKWINTIRKATNMPKAVVHLIREEQWDAPKLRSPDGGAASCTEGIQKYFKAHNLAPMSRDDFQREHLGDLTNPISGLLVVLVMQSGQPRRRLP